VNFQVPELVVFITDSDEESGNLPEPEPSSGCLSEYYFSGCSLVLTTP